MGEVAVGLEHEQLRDRIPTFKIGPVQKSLYDEDQAAVNWLRGQYCPKKTEIDRLKVEFELLDLGQFLTENESGNFDIDIARLGPAIVDKKPNIILLAFCFSKMSELNDQLISVGIYANLMFQEDSLMITRGRCITLGSEQQQFVKTIGRKKPRAILIHGPFGSGKTLLASQCARMMVSQLGGQLGEQKIHLVVCAGYSVLEEEKSQLLIELKTKHGLPTNGDKVTVKFSTLVQLCFDFGLEVRGNGKEDMIAVIESLVSRVGIKKLVFLVDEIPVGDGKWSAIEKLICDHSNLHIVVSLRPLNPCEVLEELPSEQTEVCQLSLQYRYCRENHEFLSFVGQKAGLSKTSAPEDKSTLPDGGSSPIWIQVRNKETIQAVAIVAQLVVGEHSVSLISDDDNIQTWFRENGPAEWKHHKDGGQMVGAEADVILLVQTKYGSITYCREMWSRARRRLFIVTTEGWKEENTAAADILKEAAEERLIEIKDLLLLQGIAASLAQEEEEIVKSVMELSLLEVVEKGDTL